MLKCDGAAEITGEENGKILHVMISSTMVWAAISFVIFWSAMVISVLLGGRERAVGTWCAFPDVGEIRNLKRNGAARPVDERKLRRGFATEDAMMLAGPKEGQRPRPWRRRSRLSIIPDHAWSADKATGQWGHVGTRTRWKDERDHGVV